MDEVKGDPKKAGIGYTIGNYLIRGIGFITLPIFSRLLTTEDFGFFNTFISYEGILFIIIGMAFHTSFKNAYLKYPDKFRDYISDCVGICLIIGTVFMMSAIILTFFIKSLTLQYAIMLIAGSTATALVAYYNAYLGIYYQSSSYLIIAGLNAIANVIVSLGLILTIFSNDRGMGRIYGKTLPIIFISFYLVYRLWKTNKPRFSKEYVRYAFRFSLPLVPHGLSQVLLSSSDRIMISNMIGNSEAGIYSFAYTLSSIVSVTYASLDQVWSPWFYESFKQKRFGDIKRNANTYMSLMSLITIIVMLICPEATLIIGSAKYESSIALAVPVIVGGYFAFIYNFAAVVEYYHEKTKYIAMGTILAAAINVFLNYYFIQKCGYVAAAYTTVFTYFLYFIFHSIIASRILNGRRLYNTYFFALMLLFVVIMAILIQFLFEWVFLRWGMAIILGIFTVIFAEKQVHFTNMFLHKLNLE